MVMILMMMEQMTKRSENFIVVSNGNHSDLRKEAEWSSDSVTGVKQDGKATSSCTRDLGNKSLISIPTLSKEACPCRHYLELRYIFDKLNSEGCGLGMRFYNTLLEALWWLGQKERAARVLNEATKRGLFPELLCTNKLVWSIDVHRMWEGGAYTALSVWLNNMFEMFKSGKDLPHVATVVAVNKNIHQ